MMKRGIKGICLLAPASALALLTGCLAPAETSEDAELDGDAAIDAGDEDVAETEDALWGFGGCGFDPYFFRWARPRLRLFGLGGYGCGGLGGVVSTTITTTVVGAGAGCGCGGAIGVPVDVVPGPVDVVPGPVDVVPGPVDVGCPDAHDAGWPDADDAGWPDADDADERK